MSTILLMNQRQIDNAKIDFHLETIQFAEQEMNKFRASVTVIGQSIFLDMKMLKEAHERDLNQIIANHHFH